MILVVYWVVAKAGSGTLGGLPGWKLDCTGMCDGSCGSVGVHWGLKAGSGSLVGLVKAGHGTCGMDRWRH